MEATVQGSPNPEYLMAHKIDRPHDHDQHDSSPQEETDESPTLVVFGFIHERTLRPVCPLPPRHLQRQSEENPPIGFLHAREQMAEPLPVADFLAGFTMTRLVRSLPPESRGQSGPVFPLVEESIEGNL
jgi:hypothetical protein